jgi:hypothetical protein
MIEIICMCLCIVYFDGFWGMKCDASAIHRVG